MTLESLLERCCGDGDLDLWAAWLFCPRPDLTGESLPVDSTDADRLEADSALTLDCLGARTSS